MDPVVLTNKDLDFTTSNHYILTYDWNVTEHLRIKAEAYYQQLRNVPVERKSSSYSAINTENELCGARAGQPRQ